MTARIVPAYTDQFDTTQNFMIECLTCGIEWYWTKDWKDPKMQASADKHNQINH